MTLYEFNQMDELEQQEAIWNAGIKIGEREGESYKYKLWQIDGFYVERKYTLDGLIQGQRTFKSPNQFLDPYLKNININKDI